MAREVGISRLAGDALAEELGEAVFEQLRKKRRLNQKQIVAPARRWPTYQGKEIGTDEIRAWLEQVEEKIQKRLLDSRFWKYKF